MDRISELFVGWYDYSKEEFEKILSEGLISFDTNVLLNLYRYSKDTSMETLSLFESIKNRLVFSYYVAEEFTRNRKKVEADSLIEYNLYITKIESKYNDLIKELNNIQDKRISSKKKLIDSINRNKDRVITAIYNDKHQKEELLNGGLELKICNLIGTKILKKYSDEEFKKIKEEGLRRVKEQIPPGYKDNEKAENGDYHIFKSLIDYCKVEKKDLIFVTDDLKEDMFSNLHGIKVPRAELLNEFYIETGQKLIILSVQEFLKNKIIFSESVSEDILSEIYLTSLENIKYSTKTNSRIKRYLYNILKNNNVESVVNNNDEIQKSFRTIIRICEGFNDVESAKKFNFILQLLKSGNYELYFSQLDVINEIIINSKNKEFKKITSFYEKYKIDNDTNIAIELLNLIILYINEYISDDYNVKSLVIKLRELVKGIKNNYVSLKILSEELDYAYNFIVSGEQEYVSI